MRFFSWLILSACLSLCIVAKANAQSPQLDIPITKNVVVVRYDPNIAESGNRPLSVVKGWANATQRSNQFRDAIANLTQGVVNYQIVDNVVLNKFPLKTDGFRYDWNSYSTCRANTTTCHMPDDVSYSELLLRDTNLCQRIQNKEVDEVWVWGAGYFGFDEFAWKIPGNTPAFQSTPYNNWIYDKRKRDLPDCGRTYFVMGWIPEVGFDNQVHSYGHRIESAMTSSAAGRGLWHRCNQGSYWTKYICINKDSQGNASCGDVHYPPNGNFDYNYSNTSSVASSCQQWQSFPLLPSTSTTVNGSTWGNSQESYLLWWLGKLPRFTGKSSDGVLSNWWRYILDYGTAALSEVGPIGWQDEPDSSSCTINGWACDPNKPYQALTVKFYENGTLIGSTMANMPNDPGVIQACEASTNNRFSYQLPENLRDGEAHSIIVKTTGIDAGGSIENSDFTLQGNPRSIICGSPSSFSVTDLVNLIRNYGGSLDSNYNSIDSKINILDIIFVLSSL